MFSNTSILRLIGQIIALILVFNIEACSCESGPNNTAVIGMTIDKPLLVGEERELMLTFQVDDSGNHAIIGDFKLKATFTEQTTVKGTTTTGSHINYGDSDFEKESLLSEFTIFEKLDPKVTNSFSVYFKLIPAQDAIKVKANFELLDTDDNLIQNVEVQWIKSKIVIDPPAKFRGKTAEFTLKNLKGNLTSEDLGKLTVKIASSKENVSFLVSLDSNPQPEANLKTLFPDTSLDEGASTNPIIITVLNPEEEAEATATIQLVTNDPTVSNPLLHEVTVEWSEFEDIRALKEKKGKLAKLEAEHTELNKQKKQLEDANAQSKEDIKTAGTNLKAAQKTPKTDANREDKIEQAKKAFKDTETKNNELIKKNEKEIKALESQIKENKKAQEKLKKEIGEEGNNEEEGSNSLPEVVMVLKGHRKPTDPTFTIEVSNNKGNELTKEVAEKINFWYELKNTSGDISAVTLNHGGKHVQPGNDNKVNLEKLSNEEVYAGWLQALEGDTKHELAFTIHPGSAESMDIIIHLEGIADAEKILTVEWKKEEEKEKEKEK